MPWNPADKNPVITVSNGDRTIVTTAGWASIRGTVGKSTGKWYYEIVADAVTANQYLMGIADLTTPTGSMSYVGGFPNSYSWGTTGVFVYYNGSGVVHGGSGGLAAGDVLGLAFDADAHRVDIYKNGVLQSSSWLDGMEANVFYPACALYETGQQATLNVLASQFLYTPPTGYSAWETPLVLLADLAATEGGPDIAAFAASVPVHADMAAVENNADSAAMLVNVVVQMVANMLEYGSDTASFVSGGILKPGARSAGGSRPRSSSVKRSKLTNGRRV